MAVGLYDADMSIYKQTIPNLELMKQAAYYKQHNQITTLTRNFEPIQYDKYIYQKDYNDGLFPRKIMSYGNVEISGLAFSNHKYKPMELEKEMLVPDRSIYETMFPLFERDKGKYKLLQKNLNAQHLRLSLDGKTVWNKFYKQISETTNQNFFFHDIDLNKIQNSTETIKDLIKNCRTASSGIISVKFPINVYNSEDLLKWLDFRWSADFFIINYYGMMDMDVFEEVIRRCHGTTKLSKIQYIVTYGFKDEQDFVDNGIEKIYDQFILACSERQKISLKYEDNFFINKEWEQFFSLLQIYNSTVLKVKKENFERYREENTLFRIVRGFNEVRGRNETFTKDEARYLFAFIREKNYPLFCKFYEQGLTKRLEE